MRSAASRLHKGFSFERRFAACENYVVQDASARAGAWAMWTPDGVVRKQPFEHVVLDLGCGKGEYTVACAQLCPDVLFVGFDVDAICTLRSAEAAAAAGVRNAAFLQAPEREGASEHQPRSGAPAELDLAAAFAPGELACILMNFPTPFPKKKKAHLRLTYLDRLLGYRPLLRRGAGVRLRTDSQPLRDFTLTQLELAGYAVTWQSDNVREEFPDEPWSAYERKLVEQGARTLGVAAVPGPAPQHAEQTAPLSLVSYLPENLDSLDYVPHGMQSCVDNLRRRHAREREQGRPEFHPPRV